ncbi:GABA transporter 1-like [Chenopodium quinoa]|uniref:GABA transporter 1-like n=1 Tax=Chenopodium quinoa TaxID=63459 RepID=UPI000B784B4C|nr:GABA transporter 1-like [Chenopodium quinoa]XP_021774157.1 GABA transporter 1-like [Chenopodium quinoa]
MGTYIVETQVVPEENTIVNQESNHERKEELDAGALFVLQSKGSWVHCGYHLTTSIVAPALLSLPYAFKFLGWAGGIICLILGAMVTFYSYNLLSLVLEHHAQLGRRHLRFRDMAHDILGPRWGRYIVGPVQFAVCYGAVVGACLIGGQCIKAIYLLFNPNGTMKLYEFIIIFGGLMLILAQMPSFHSLRHINLISLLLCLGYSAAATVGSVYIGHKSKGPEKDYSLVGNSEDRLFGVFNAIAIIATTFGNGIIPEIQATLAPPVKGKMFKGLSVCYSVVSMTFFSVAVSGYWAFGNQAEGQILSNFVVNGNPFLPKWFIFMTNAFVILQISAVGVIYLQPTNEVLEGVLADPKSGQFSLRNVIPRVISRSLSVAIATIISAMLPFFGDINGVIGAFGFLPLDFVLPVILFNLTFKPSKRTFIFWLNLSIAVVFSILGVIGSVAAVRQIILDAKSYKLFANV